MRRAQQQESKTIGNCVMAGYRETNVGSKTEGEEEMVEDVVLATSAAGVGTDSSKMPNDALLVRYKTAFACPEWA